MSSVGHSVVSFVRESSKIVSDTVIFVGSYQLQDNIHGLLHKTPIHFLIT